MKFDKEDITIVDTLNKVEAKAYIEFLLSEKRRHIRDIEFIDKRIKEVKERFKL